MSNKNRNLERLNHARWALETHVRARENISAVNAMRVLNTALPGDHLDHVADLITDLLHYAQIKGLITTVKQAEDLAGRAVRNYRAEKAGMEG